MAKKSMRDEKKRDWAKNLSNASFLHCLIILIILLILLTLIILNILIIFIILMVCLTNLLTTWNQEMLAHLKISHLAKRKVSPSIYFFCVVKKIPILRRALHHSLSQSTWLVQHTLHITLRFCFFSVSFWAKVYSAYTIYHPQIFFWATLHIILQGVPK